MVWDIDRIQACMDRAGWPRFDPKPDRQQPRPVGAALLRLEQLYMIEEQGLRPQVGERIRRIEKAQGCA